VFKSRRRDHFPEKSILSEQARWRVGFLLCLVVACSALLRFVDISHRPVHHDEGVNAWFVERLVERGAYQYSPHDYHGPTFYYFGWVATTLFGRDVSVLRMMTALFGFALTLTPLVLLPELGWSGVLVSMAAIGLSPGEVYHSRYAIHEILYAFFTGFSALAFYRYWRGGQLSWLILGSVMFATAAATKETIIVWIACMGAAVALMSLQEHTRGGELTLRTRLTPTVLGIAVAVTTTGLFVWFRPKELLDFFKGYSFYLHLGTSKTGHEKPWHYFPMLLWDVEPFLVFGGLAGLVATMRRREPLGLFLSAWSITALAVQSLIKYKTPWMVVNLTTPLGLLTGYAAAMWLAEPALKQRQSLIKAGVVLGLGVSAWKAHYLSFVEYNEAKNSYSYVQTYESAHVLERRLKEFAAKYPAMKIYMVSDETWPYPFLLGKTPQVVIVDKIPEPFQAKVFVIRDTLNHLPESFLANYDKELYPIRGGLDFELYIDRRL